MAMEVDLNNKDIDIISQKCQALLFTYSATTYLDEIGTGWAWIADVKVESLYLRGVIWT